ncbi:VENN motif pre-toxin domain-containing protein [Pectobacterium brasiliense]|uniref:VENN motif pre-toxin domain-containing protein n=1 Tax=Pectobacterium brasiliense TaxID=180957 RepID=UPI0020A090D1|nr:VENN motif pre-toxin domain-containing protein [Pectobacterium brasiliense]
MAGAAGAATGELAARVIADRLYQGKTISEMTESEKQTVTTLSLLAGGLAAGTVGDSTTNAVAGVQASQNAVENNLFYPGAVPKGVSDYGQSATSLYTNTNLTDEKGNVLNPTTDEQRQYAMHKLVTGTMPEGQDPVHRGRSLRPKPRKRRQKRKQQVSLLLILAKCISTMRICWLTGDYRVYFTTVPSFNINMRFPFQNSAR